MKMQFVFEGREIVISTEHAASSYGKPVMTIDGTLIGEVEYEPDVCNCNALDAVADMHHIHNGPRTRADLRALMAEMIPGGATCGHDYDRVCIEFRRRAVRDE